MRSIIYDKKNSMADIVGSSWQGIGSSIESTLQSPYIESYGSGKFGMLGQNVVFSKTTGASSNGLKEGVDFAYNKRLDASTTEDSTDGFGSVSGGVIDTEISGDIATDKAFRILDYSSGSAINIKTLGLKVYAKALSILSSPPHDRIYLDPLTGKYVLPRPVYFNRCENISTIDTPEIGSELSPYSATSGGGYFDCVSVKFDHGYRVYVYAESSVTRNSYIYPFYNRQATKKQIISFWGRAYADANSADNDNENDSWSMCYINSNTYFGLYAWGVAIEGGANHHYCNFYIVVNGSTVYSLSVSPNTVYHLGVSYDFNGDNSFGDNSTMKFYLNGILKYSSSYNLNISEHYPYFRLYTGIPNPGSHSSASWANIDNIKIWEDDPSLISTLIPLEYNDGTGRENMMHNMYSGTYNPVIKVKYKYIPNTDGPAILPKPTGGNQIIPLESISNYSNGLGYFGLGHRISDVFFNTLIENEDYYYNETLNGTGDHLIDIYDNNAEGDFSTGKIIRVVENGKNLTDATGLNLTPIARKMLLNTYSAPPNSFYIDPDVAKIVLPRPVFWSKCESVVNVLTTPEINTFNITTTNADVFNTVSGKFNQGCANISSGKTALINFNATLLKGAVSIYLSSPIATSYLVLRSYIAIQLATLFSIGLDMYGNGSGGFYSFGVYMGNVDGTRDYYSIDPQSYIHFYIIWDNTKSITGGKSISVYINGVERFSRTSDFTPTELSILSYTSAYSGTNAEFDNIKIWNHIPSEDPSWEYNSGSGRENALHYIYGATHDYAPYNLQVGYYKNSSVGNLVRGEI